MSTSSNNTATQGSEGCACGSDCATCAAPAAPANNEQLRDMLQRIVDDADATGCEGCYVVSADVIQEANALLATGDVVH